MSSQIVDEPFVLFPRFTRDRTKMGFILECDTPEATGDFHPEFVPVVETGKPTTAKEVLERLKPQGNLGGQRHLESILRQGRLVPKEVQECILIEFGTIWVKNDVPHLVAAFFGIHSWNLNMIPLTLELSENCRALLIKSQPTT